MKYRIIQDTNDKYYIQTHNGGKMFWNKWEYVGHYLIPGAMPFVNVELAEYYINQLKHSEKRSKEGIKIIKEID